MASAQCAGKRPLAWWCGNDWLAGQGNEEKKGQGSFPSGGPRTAQRFKRNYALPPLPVVKQKPSRLAIIYVTLTSLAGICEHTR